MNILIWHWGRHGAGPRFAASLAAGFAALPNTTAQLSLPVTAEVLTIPNAPTNHLPVRTYSSPASLAWRLATAPAFLRHLNRALDQSPPHLAICAMPAALDALMLHTLRRRAIPSALILHDATAHAGEPWPLRIALQRHAARRATHCLSLSPTIGKTLASPSLFHPPFDFGPMPPPLRHGGPLRLLVLGRLLAYKGLDLMAATLARLPPAQVQIRIAGQGPETSALAKLRALPHVELSNRWVPEAELPALLAWSDTLLLTHHTASQSGIAAAALGAGRFLIAPDIPGLADQLACEPGVQLCPPDPARLAAAILALTQARPPTLPNPVVPDHGAAWSSLATAILRHTQPA